MRSAGLLNFLYLRWLLRRLGLPPLRAALGFRGLLRLAGPRAPLPPGPRGGGRGRRHRARLPRAAARPGLRRAGPAAALAVPPVFLVPALLLWSRRAQRLQPSVWDVLYGSPEAPSAFANAVGFLRSFRRAVFVVGRALDLQAFLADAPPSPTPRWRAGVRGALHQHLARELRAAVGPPLKTPARVREQGAARPHAAGRPLARWRRGAAAPPTRCWPRPSGPPGDRQPLRPALHLGDALSSWPASSASSTTSVEVDEAGLARVKRAAADAPLVLCPSHKSYVDFLVLSWLLYERGMTPPHVAAGINLAFWPFGAIARRGGAFFIRRTVKGDRVYTAVLRAYVKQLLRDRFPQEFYVEGGRSRTGKLLFPKMGLVSMEVDAWLDGAADDVLFVPVAIDYERLIEASAYARELAGGEKKKENLRDLLGAAGVLLRRYERLYVQFEEPVSLARVARDRLGDRAEALSVDEAWGGETHRATLEAGQRGAPAETKRQLVQAMATRIAYGIGRAVTITPVGLVAAALLSHGAPRARLRRAGAAGGAAPLHGGRGRRPLRPGPGRRLATPASRGRSPTRCGGWPGRAGAGRAWRPASTVYQVVDEKRPVLDYHRNAVLHRFVGAGPGAPRSARAAGPARRPEAEVRARTLWLSRLFKLEFMYRVGAPLRRDLRADAGVPGRGWARSARGRRGCARRRAAAAGLPGALLRPYLEAYRLTAATARRCSPPTHRGRRRSTARRWSGRPWSAAGRPSWRETSPPRGALQGHARERRGVAGRAGDRHRGGRQAATSRRRGWRGTPRHHRRDHSASRGVRVRSSPSTPAPLALICATRKARRRAARRSRHSIREHGRLPRRLHDVGPDSSQGPQVEGDVRRGRRRAHPERRRARHVRLHRRRLPEGRPDRARQARARGEAQGQGVQGRRPHRRLHRPGAGPGHGPHRGDQLPLPVPGRRRPPAEDQRGRRSSTRTCT